MNVGGAAASQGGVSTSPSGKPKYLNMLYATREANVDAINLAIPAFATTFGVDINLDTKPFSSLQPKIFSELVSGSSFYDVMSVDVSMMATVVGQLEPLSPYIANSALNTDFALNLGDFMSKVFFDTVVFNSSKPHLHHPHPDKVDVDAIINEGFDIYGVPIQANALTLSYRKDLFQNAEEKATFQRRFGKPLQSPETWDDFVNVASFFTRPDKRLHGTTLMAGSGDWATDDFKTMVAAWGGDGHLVSDDFQLAFNSSQAVAALGFYSDLINKHRVTPPGVTSFSWDEAESAFDSGLTAMSMNYHQGSLIVPGEVSYALVPMNVARGPHFGTWMLSVNKFSKNKEWAYRAAAWFTTAAVQTKMLQAQLHPTRTSVYEKARADPSLQKFGNFYEVLGKSLAVGVGRPRLTNYPDVDESIWDAVNSAARGLKSPADALSQAAIEVRAELKEAGYAAG
jgi:multiple sugar transport system substrate-binding protein